MVCRSAFLVMVKCCVMTFLLSKPAAPSNSVGHKMDTILAFIGKEVRGFKIKKEFEQTGGNVERGDIVLLRRTSGNWFTNLFVTPTPSYHAGVCKGDDLIIHLAEAGGGLFKVHPGNVCLQKVKGFTFEKEFRILQKVDGVPDSFDTDVIEAMDSDDQHDESRHNCIDFALKLLKVDPERYHGPEGTTQSDAPQTHEQNEEVPLMASDKKGQAPPSQPEAPPSTGEDVPSPSTESQDTKAPPSQPEAPPSTGEDVPSPSTKSHDTNLSPSNTEDPHTKADL